MNHKKKYKIRDFKDQDITNGYIFMKVMEDKEIAKKIIKVLFDIDLGQIKEKQEEKLVKYSNYSKGIVLDSYIEDQNRIVNLEMQVKNKGNLIERAKHYSSMLNINVYKVGDEYKDEKEMLVAFICKFDLFKDNKVIYEYKYRRDEDFKELGDKSKIIYLNLLAYEKETNKQRKALMKYMAIAEVSDDELVLELDKIVKYIKENEEWRVEYMKYEWDRIDLLNEGREEGMVIGEKRGISIGEERGISIGEEQGRIKTQLLVAKNLLGKMSDEEIANITKLEVSKINSLRVQSLRKVV